MRAKPILQEDLFSSGKNLLPQLKTLKLLLMF
nr:MAG TPA_asm: hypothetical protein [Caudoviricetes sp.]